MAHALLYTGIAVLLLTWVGNQLCRAIFGLSGLRDAIAHLPTPAHSAGRWIGVLERLLLAIGIVVHSWELLAAVIALKSLARFKDMEKRYFAEYFLVGSLFSILWTMIVTGAWMAYDHRIGSDMRGTVARWVGGSAAGG